MKDWKNIAIAVLVLVIATILCVNSGLMGRVGDTVGVIAAKLPFRSPAGPNEEQEGAARSNASNSTASDPSVPHPPEGDLAVEEWIGINVWGGDQVNLNLPPLAADQILLAHGDVLGNGTCAVKIFKPGEQIVLSDATWQLYRFTGAPEEIAQAIVEHQMEAAKDLDPDGDPTVLCPILGD